MAEATPRLFIVLYTDEDVTADTSLLLSGDEVIAPRALWKRAIWGLPMKLNSPMPLSGVWLS